MNNAIYFHSSEGVHHFLLKCAVCFVLERLGKQFQTEKPFAARKVYKHYGEENWYDGRNDYDVYDLDSDVPYEILLAQTESQMPALIKSKKDEYPPNTVYVLYDYQCPDIERIWNEQLVPLWVFQTDEFHAWRTEWMDKKPPDPNKPFDWNKFGSPFKPYMRIEDVLPEIEWRYRRELEDIKKVGVDAKAISKARAERVKKFRESGMSKEQIDAMDDDTIGVKSVKAIERRLKKLEKYGLLKRA
jgi:hypothetical protein